MSYIIGPECIDELDRSCIEVCPVDCIYIGDRKSYINGTECIDCGACEVECPVSAIVVDRVAKKNPLLKEFMQDSIDFFEQPLPGRSDALGNPGGAGDLGDLGVDTKFVADYAS